MSYDPEHMPEPSAAHEQFTRLFTLNQRRVYLFIRSLVANPADVDEIWAETNLVLWQRFDDFQPDTNFFAWAQRIAYNKVLNYRTHRRQPVQFSEEFLERLATRAGEASESDRTYLDAMNHCVEKLPTNERELLQLRYNEQSTCQKVAESLGRPVQSIYNALTRIRSQLLACVRRELGKEERE
jgi:RNA polymerase sigma-70 factor (ECF subfamily)